MRAASVLLAIVLALAGLGYYFTAVNPIQNQMKLGLDLKGGVHMVLEGVDSEVGEVTKDKMEKAMKVIDNRVNSLGVSEPSIQLDGNNRIIVELADVQDTDKAKEIIGKTAVLQFVGPDGSIILDGNDVDKAGVSKHPNGTADYVVNLAFKGEGTNKFAEATRKFIHQPIMIVLDDEVISAPTVNTEINTGSAYIEGGFTVESAKELADLINGGALPVKLSLIENRVVSSQLGTDSLARSAKAGVVGLIAILVFMLVVYRLPGILANIALIIYTMLTIGVLVALNAVFTLPGLAGLLLSIGMAVDGNIIIFERIKEELRSGKGLRSGIDAGFRRAFAAIFDGQITTAIAGGVLFYLGTGPVKGFAVTLVIGVMLSIFTSVTVSRWLINLTVATGWFKRSLFGVKEVAE